MLTREARDRGIDIASKAQHANLESDVINYLEELDKELSSTDVKTEEANTATDESAELLGNNNKVIEPINIENMATSEDLTKLNKQEDSPPVEEEIENQESKEEKPEENEKEETQDEIFTPSEKELTKAKLELKASADGDFDLRGRMT